MIDVVGQVLPDSLDLFGLCLAAELALDPDLAGDAGDLAGEPVELVDHGVDGVLQLEKLPPHISGDLLAEVAVGHGGRHLGDVADLPGEVARHQVDVVGQLLPDSADLDRVRGRLAELALRPHLASDSRDLRDESVELIDHPVDRVLQHEHLALNLDGDLLAQIPVGDCSNHPLHFIAGANQILDQAVDRFDAVAPHLVSPFERDALGQLALFTDDAADATDLVTQRLVGPDDVVQAVGDLARHSRPVDRHASSEVTSLDGAQNLEQHLRVTRLNVGGRSRGHHVTALRRGNTGLRGSRTTPAMLRP